MGEPARQEQHDMGVSQIESVNRVISKIIPGMIEGHEHDGQATGCINFGKALTFRHGA
jgi:hypothetical protein